MENVGAMVKFWEEKRCGLRSWAEVLFDCSGASLVCARVVIRYGTAGRLRGAWGRREELVKLPSFQHFSCFFRADGVFAVACAAKRQPDQFLFVCSDVISDEHQQQQQQRLDTRVLRLPSTSQEIQDCTSVRHPSGSVATERPDFWAFSLRLTGPARPALAAEITPSPRRGY